MMNTDLRNSPPENEAAKLVVSWQLDELKGHITRLYGSEQLELARPCIRSVVDRQIYASIHYRDAQAKVNSYLAAEFQHDSMLEDIFEDQESWGKFNFFIREVAAHLTACVQSMHAVPDIMAHVVYYGLGFNRLSTPLKSRDVGVKSVLKLLKRDTGLSTLHSLLEKFADDDNFVYLSALANQAKHRSIIFPEFSEDWTGKRADCHTIMIPAFSFEGIRHPQVVAKEFLQLEYARGSKAIVDIGVELNAILQGRGM